MPHPVPVPVPVLSAVCFALTERGVLVVMNEEFGANDDEVKSLMYGCPLVCLPDSRRPPIGRNGHRDAPEDARTVCPGG